MLGTSSKTGRVSTPRVPPPERPPMPHGDEPPPARSAVERAAAFSAWLVDLMTERALSTKDMVLKLNHRTYDSAFITNLRKGRYAPSELAAWRFADALALPAPVVLRAAGYDEMADRVEHIAAHGVQLPPQDPVLAELEKVGLPELTAPLAREYERDLFAARRRAELELAELRRRLERGGEQDAAEPR